MLENKDLTQLPPPAPSEAPPPAQAAPPPAEPAGYAKLSDVLGKARGRLRAVHIRAALFAALGLLLLLWPLPVAFAEASLLARMAARLLPLLALVGFLVGGPLWVWRRSRDDEETARLLAGYVPHLRSTLLSAVELERELASGRSGFSPELARAHIAQAGEAASGLDLEQVLPRRKQQAGALVLGVGLSVTILCLAFAPRLFVLGLGRLLAGEEGGRSLNERLAEPITYDIELTYQYPAYTGLPTRVVQGTSGEIAAPAGTEVKLKTRADRDVEKAFVVVGEQALPLAVEGKRGLAGAVLVRAPGSYHFRFADAKGRTLAEGPPIAIAVEADAPPKVTLYAPAREVEVDPRGQVKLRYEAEDDYGLGSIDLVFRLGGAKAEQRISLSKDASAPRRVGTEYSWPMPGLSLSAGDRVTYWLEARDNDAVAGPKLGKSKEQVLKVYSEAEHHRLALKRVEQLWNQMIGQLGESIEQPDRVKPLDTNAVAAGQNTDQHAFDLITGLTEAATDLRKDKSAPKEIPRALSNIAGSLRGTTYALSEARITFNRWSRPGAPEPAASRRLGTAAEAQIAELEKDTIYLEKLLDHRRIEDLQALAKDLAAKRRDLQELLERYQKAPDDQTKAAIQADIARLKERIGELMERMRELSRSISDEHLNSDALKQMQQSDSMQGRLDKIQELLNQGKVDEAMKELQRLGDQMDQLQNGLDKAKGGFEGRQDPETSRKFSEFNDQLAAVAKEQRALEKEAKAVKQANQSELKKKLEEKGADFANKLRQKIAQSKKALKDSADGLDSSRFNDDAQNASEALDELDRALAAKDFDAAAEEASKAYNLEEQLASELKTESLRARRYPGFAPADPQQLDQAAQKADQAMPPLLDAKKELEQLFPRGSQQLSSEDRQKLQSLQKRQQSLEQQQNQLQQAMDDINKKAPIFNPQMKGQMQQAGAQMSRAEGSMSERDPTGSASHAGEAAGKLEQLQQSVKEAMKGQKGGGGGGLMLPAPDPGEGDEQDEENGDGTRSADDKPDLRPTQPGGDEYRKDIMDAMKQSAPARYKDQVKKYYEEIVK